MPYAKFRISNNLYGNAWNLFDTSYGEEVPLTEDYANLKVNDLINLSRGAFRSDTEKGIPSSNQHVGRISKIEDGVPYVKHYIGDRYYEEPINDIREKFRYTPSRAMRLDQFKDITPSKPKLKHDFGYNPNAIERDVMKSIRNDSKQIQDVLKIGPQEYDRLSKLSYGVLGAESSFGRSKRTFYRMSTPDFAQRIAKVLHDEYRGIDSYDRHVNNLSRGYGSVKESSMHGVTDDRVEELKEIQRRVGAVDDGIYGNETRKKIEEYNKANPNKPINWKTADQKIRDRDFRGLQKTNNYLYGAMQSLGLNPDNLENGKNSYQSVMAALTWHLKRNPESTDEDLLKSFTGKKDISTYSNTVSDYMKNIDSNPDNNMTHSTKDKAWGIASHWANKANALLKNYKDKGVNALLKRTPISINKKAFIADILGSKSPITEENLSKKEIEALTNIVKSKIEEGGKNISYKDYKSKGGAYADVGAKYVGLKKVLGGNPNYALKTFLGQAGITEDDINWYVNDSFDYNDHGKSFGILDDLMKKGPSPYHLMRSAGRNYGSTDGQGAKVRITIPKSKNGSKMN